MEKAQWYGLKSHAMIEDMEQKVNIYLIEDHPAIIIGIKGHLKELADQRFAIVGEAKNNQEAGTFLDFQASTFAGIVLLDIGLGDQPMYGYDFAKKVMEKGNPALKIIVYSMRNEVEVIRKMIEAGVSGYVDKNVSLDVLYEALLTVADGEDYYSRGSVSKAVSFLLKNPKAEQEFTPAEQEVLALMRRGLSTYKAIAEELCRSPRTVEQHLKNIYQKTGTNNMASLSVWIHQHYPAE